MDEEPPAYVELVESLLEDPRVSESQMMGMPVLKLGSKIFGGRSGGDLVLKLGRDRVGVLIESGRGMPFNPSRRGRAMTGWVTLPPPAADWHALALEAQAALDA